VQQPVHRHGYKDFEGVIPSGYGAGRVKKHEEGQVLITKATPESVHFTTAHQRHPERFVLARPKGWGNKNWLLMNTTPRDPVPYGKVHYKKIPPEAIEPHLQKMQEGDTVEAKVDGASQLVQLAKNHAEMLSFRTSKMTGRPIFHTERFFGGRPEIPVPKHLEGSILKGEMYAARTGRGTNGSAAGMAAGPGGRAEAEPQTSDADAASGGAAGRARLGPQDVGTLLNSSIARSLQLQKERGLTLRNMLYDVQQYGKKPIDPSVTPRAERRRMLEEILAHLPQDKFHLSEEHHGSEAATKLWNMVRGGAHPLTQEGAVFWPRHGVPSKAKLMEDVDAFITGTFPGEGKRRGTVGGLTYARTAGGPTVGKIGTGFSDATLEDIARDPSAYIGRVARVKTQQQLPSGALRVPSFIGLHEDYPNKPGGPFRKVGSDRSRAEQTAEPEQLVDLPLCLRKSEGHQKFATNCKDEGQNSVVRLSAKRAEASTAPDTRHVEDAGLCGMAQHDPAVHRQRPQGLSKVGWSRHNGLSGVAGLHSLLQGHGATTSKSDYRTAGQQRPILQGQLLLGNQVRTSKEQTEQPDINRRWAGTASFGLGRTKQGAVRHDHYQTISRLFGLRGSIAEVIQRPQWNISTKVASHDDRHVASSDQSNLYHPGHNGEPATKSGMAHPTVHENLLPRSRGVLGWDDLSGSVIRLGELIGLVQPAGLKTADEKPYRDRAEMYAMSGGKVYGGIYDKDRTHGVFGGGIDPGEDPAAAGAREFFEESGRTVADPVLLPVPPVLHEWKPPYRTPQQAERSKTYRGTRTFFTAGRLTDDPYVPPSLSEPSGLTQVKLRHLDTAIRRIRQYKPEDESKPFYTGRIAALKALKTHPIAKLASLAGFGNEASAVDGIPERSPNVGESTDDLIAEDKQRKPAPPAWVSKLPTTGPQDGAGMIPTTGAAEGLNKLARSMRIESCPPGECCPKCGARLEQDPRTGKCNRCGHVWSEKAAAPHPILADLKRAKAESDRKNYSAKHAILAKLLSERPNEFIQDSAEDGIVGLTHIGTNFRIHAPRKVVGSRLTKAASFTSPDLSYNERNNEVHTRGANGQDTRAERFTDVSQLGHHAATVREPEKPEVRGLWRSGDQGLPALAEVRELLGRYGRMPTRTDDRAEGQRQGLLPGQLHLGVAGATSQEPALLPQDHVQRKDAAARRVGGRDGHCQHDVAGSAQCGLVGQTGAHRAARDGEQGGQVPGTRWAAAEHQAMGKTAGRVADHDQSEDQERDGDSGCIVMSVRQSGQALQPQKQYHSDASGRDSFAQGLGRKAASCLSHSIHATSTWLADRTDLRSKLAQLNVEMQPYQRRVAGRVAHGDGLLVYHGLGSGKTRSAIEAAKAIGGPYAAITPASLRENFRKEVGRWDPGSAPDILSYTGVGMGKQPQHIPNTIILDEAQRIRNPESAGARAAMNLAMTAPHRVLLSGTPIVNQPSDLAVPLSILTGKEMTPAAFNQKFVGSTTVSPGWMGWLQGVKSVKVPSLQNEDDLERLLEGHVDYQASRSPEGVKTNDERVEVNLSPEQQDFYKLMWGKMPWLMRWKLSNDYPLTKQELGHLSAFMTGPRQAALSLYPYHSSKDPMRAFQTSAKLQSAMGNLKQTLASNPQAKALVYSNFIDAGLTPYAAALEHEGIPYGQFHGEMPDEQRKQMLDEYNAGKRRVLLIGPAGAEGISAKGTQLIQLLDPHWNEARLGQARGRGLRYDSHEGLPPELRNVRIQRYVAKMPPPGWLSSMFGAKPRPSADEVLERQSQRKEELNEQFREVLRRVGSPGYKRPWHLFG
jgi:8-oxo-dGTP pyrophosphatase MutT (NUDIX family)